MFKIGDIVEVVRTYNHPLTNETKAITENATLPKGLIGEILNVITDGTDCVNVWFPTIRQYTYGTSASHFKKISK